MYAACEPCSLLIVPFLGFIMYCGITLYRATVMLLSLGTPHTWCVYSHLVGHVLVAVAALVSGHPVDVLLSRCSHVAQTIHVYVCV